MLTSTDFEELWNPHYPLATNSFDHGFYPREREVAIGMRFVQTSAPTYQNLMILDFDSPTASWDIKSLVWDEGKLPEPSFVTVNPASNHAHAGWFIEGAVSTPTARKYFDDTFKKYKKHSGSDGLYTGQTMRNPLHSWQQTEWLSDHLYSLKELNEVVKDVKLSTNAANTHTPGEGRNAFIFDELRAWAYGNRRHYTDSFEVWLEAVIERSFAVNGETFPENPLPSSELAAISRSVARYVWNMKEFTPEGFSERQRQVSARKAISLAAPARYTEALAYSEAGFTAREVGEALNLSQPTAKKLIQRAKQWSRNNS